MKLLHAEDGGMVLYVKRLEEGTFRLPAYDSRSRSYPMEWRDLVMMAEGAVYVSAVDFTLQQLVSKGNGSAWVSDVTEFEKPVTLNVSIDDYVENYDYIVIRNHNGEITKLDTTANEGTISFETNRFSTYVILKKEKSGAGQDSSDTAESGVDAGIGEIKNSMTDSPVTGYDDMAGLYVCLMFMSVLVSSAVLKKSAGV